MDLPVVGDAKQALEMLLAEPVVQNNTEKWIEKVTKDKERVRSYDKKERMAVSYTHLDVYKRQI